MKIAYVSFEFPPDTALGGIATYIYQVSKMMAGRGHQVEVFTSSPNRSISEMFEGVHVHRIHTEDRFAFPREVLPKFTERHEIMNFDVIESPEFRGDGYEIKKKYPNLPLVVKLHTPDALIHELDNFYINETTSAYAKVKYIIGGWVKMQKRPIYWDVKNWPRKEQDIDYRITALADQIHTPSISLGDIISKKWDIDRNKILNVPYPFIPNVDFLDIPVESDSYNVSFIGRLEIRKGIIELLKAIPDIFEAVPQSTFTFIGKPMHSILPNVNMKEYIETKLSRYKNRIHFLTVQYSEIPMVLRNTDVCVFPSLWENFPNVCLEAMSAGKAIVGSKEGGMKDMLAEPKAGVLIDPLDPKQISSAIIQLLQCKQERNELGKAARKKVVNEYSAERIGSLMENCYNELISKVVLYK